MLASVTSHTTHSPQHFWGSRSGAVTRQLLEDKTARRYDRSSSSPSTPVQVLFAISMLLDTRSLQALLAASFEFFGRRLHQSHGLCLVYHHRLSFGRAPAPHRPPVRRFPGVLSRWTCLAVAPMMLDSWSRRRAPAEFIALGKAMDMFGCNTSWSVLILVLKQLRASAWHTS